jgi:hypothetical protein
MVNCILYFSTLDTSGHGRNRVQCRHYDQTRKIVLFANRKVLKAFREQKVEKFIPEYLEAKENHKICQQQKQIMKMREKQKKKEAEEEEVATEPLTSKSDELCATVHEDNNPLSDCEHDDLLASMDLTMEVEPTKNEENLKPIEKKEPKITQPLLQTSFPIFNFNKKSTSVVEVEKKKKPLIKQPTTTIITKPLNTLPTTISKPINLSEKRSRKEFGSNQEYLLYREEYLAAKQKAYSDLKQEQPATITPVTQPATITPVTQPDLTLRDLIRKTDIPDSLHAIMSKYLEKSRAAATNEQGVEVEKKKEAITITEPPTKKRKLEQEQPTPLTTQEQKRVVAKIADKEYLLMISLNKQFRAGVDIKDLKF